VNDVVTEQLEQKIGYIFIDKNTLQQALTRPAFAKEQKDKKQECKNQEPLSTLGDGVLRAILVDLLMEQGVDRSGEITKKKSELEKNKTLQKIAVRWDLSSFIRMGKGEKETEDATNKILADTVEAVIGAIYRDGGYEITKKVVNRWYIVQEWSILSRNRMEVSEVRVICTLKGKPAEFLLELKRQGIVASVREAVVQGLLELHAQRIERDLKEARLKTLVKAEQAMSP